MHLPSFAPQKKIAYAKLLYEFLISIIRRVGICPMQRCRANAEECIRIRRPRTFSGFYIFCNACQNLIASPKASNKKSVSGTKPQWIDFFYWRLYLFRIVKFIFNVYLNYSFGDTADHDPLVAFIFPSPDFGLRSNKRSNDRQYQILLNRLGIGVSRRKRLRSPKIRSSGSGIVCSVQNFISPRSSNERTRFR